jgi:hypothetical protein
MVKVGDLKITHVIMVAIVAFVLYSLMSSLMSSYSSDGFYVGGQSVTECENTGEKCTIDPECCGYNEGKAYCRGGSGLFGHCTTTVRCSETEKYDKTSNTCVCKEDYHNINGSCIKCKDGSIYEDFYQNGKLIKQCSCLNNNIDIYGGLKKYNYKNETCEPCGKAMYLDHNTQKCKCFNNYKLNEDGQCVSNELSEDCWFPNGVSNITNDCSRLKSKKECEKNLEKKENYVEKTNMDLLNGSYKCKWIQIDGSMCEGGEKCNNI